MAIKVQTDNSIDDSRDLTVNNGFFTGIVTATSFTGPGGVPPGVLFYYPSQTIPEGYLECDGSEVSRSVYNNLFNEIGTLYGSGDGATTFNIPDFRGEFLRVWDNGRGIDTDRVLGSFQGPSVGSHEHTGSAANLPHTHTANTGTQNAPHSHPANTGGRNCPHNHPGSTGGQNMPHGHPGSTGSANCPHSHPTLHANRAPETNYVAKNDEANTRSVFNTQLNSGARSTPHTHPVSVSSRSVPHTHPASVGGRNVPHKHPFSVGTQNMPHAHPAETVAVDTPHSHPVSESAGAETRPINMALITLIKF